MKMMQKKASLRAFVGVMAVFAASSTVVTGVASAGTQHASGVIQAMPAIGAPLADWQSWATSQRESLASTNPASLVTPSSGCSISSETIEPVVSTGAAGIPAGIVTDEVVVVGSCSASSVGASPLISSYCPNMTSCNYASAINGEVAVGEATVNGNPTWMSAA